MAEDPTPVRLVVDNAELIPPPLEAEDNGAGDDGAKKGGSGLPRDCPVTPLGLNDDGQFYYLDAIRQLRVLKEKDHSRLGLLALFNHRWPILQETWPRMTKDGVITGWRPERAAEELIGACGRKGPLDIADKVRGPGAWAGHDGELILHCGDRVLTGRTWRKPGPYDGFIYPAANPAPPPAEIIALGGHRGPAQELLNLFKSWNWRQPEVAPHLLLGWVAAAKLGGALPWRPTLWITGDLSTGKSTLLALLALIMGAGGVHAVTDTTPAGIWQTTRHSSLPVTLDEAEAELDGRRMSAIIRLARTASSGGVTYRGGSEHHPVTFTIRCCFLFSSILIPGLEPQDWSRIAVLELDQIVKGAPAPAIDGKKMRALGEALTRRLVDHWARLPEAFAVWRQALAEHGHQARGADQYGALMACADLLLHDGEQAIPSDELQLWGERLKPSRVAAYSDGKRDHQRCVDRLLSSIVDPYRNGSRRTIAQWVRQAMEPSADEPMTANAVLETYGMVVHWEDMPAGRVWWLMVANTHTGLAQLFQGTHWAPMGGSTSAPWAQALLRVPGAVRARRIRFAGHQARCTKLPLAELLDPKSEVDDEE